MTIGECRAAYANQINIIDSSVLCAGAEGKDTCQVCYENKKNTWFF